MTLSVKSSSVAGQPAANGSADSSPMAGAQPGTTSNFLFSDLLAAMLGNGGVMPRADSNVSHSGQSKSTHGQVNGSSTGQRQRVVDGTSAIQQTQRVGASLERSQTKMTSSTSVQTSLRQQPVPSQDDIAHGQGQTTGEAFTHMLTSFEARSASTPGVRANASADAKVNISTNVKANADVSAVTQANAHAPVVLLSAGDGQGASKQGQADRQKTTGQATTATHHTSDTTTAVSGLASSITPMNIPPTQTADAPTAHQIDVQDPHALDQFAQLISVKADGDQGQLHVQVVPAGMGELNVTVTKVDNGLQIQVVANQASTFAWLNQQLPNLEQSMQAAGFTVANMQLSFGQSGQQDHGDGRQQKGSQIRRVTTGTATQLTSDSEAADLATQTVAMHKGGISLSV
ncbi:flagellar hook-length control protein FliK [Alicyclobacillus fodiniaquatilis]|uniref:Flagellar hook-length control protein FliK n=1 Tax=Alicyclobacillus fodiniaquatilis TaxID=1661150 RepID=A0ABW4JFI0_9BACL